MTQHNDGDKKWLKTNPVVTDTAILVPTQQYCQEGTSVTYREVITKEVFIEAYKMWILPHQMDAELGDETDESNDG